MAERHEKAPPQRFRCRPVHVVTTSVSGAPQKWCSSTTDRGKKLERKSSNQNKAGQSSAQENLAHCGRPCSPIRRTLMPRERSGVNLGLQQSRSKEEITTKGLGLPLIFA